MFSEKKRLWKEMVNLCSQPTQPALTFHLLRLQLCNHLSSGFSISQLWGWFNPSASRSCCGVQSSSKEQFLVGWSSTRPSVWAHLPRCRSAFSCSHWRHRGSQETVAKESFILCLEKTTEQSFNQGHRGCCSPRILTYVLAVAPWKCRFESPGAKEGTEPRPHRPRASALTTTRSPMGIM